MSGDNLHIRVPNNNPMEATVELDGEPIRCSAIDIRMRPNELVGVTMELLPEDIDMELEAEPVFKMAPLITGIDLAKPGSDRTVMAEIRADRKPAKRVITSAREVEARAETSAPIINGLQRIVANALVDSMFDRIEREGGKSFLDSFKLFVLRMDDAKGYDPYNRCPV